MVANTGTYVDAPFHRYADGADVAELPLESLAHLDGVAVRCSEPRVTRDHFGGVDVRGKAVLIRTEWARHWRTEAYFHGHPFVTREAAQFLADSGAVFVGIDSYNIDDTADPTRPAHSILLRAGIPICEHMCNLEALPPAGFRFSAVPVKVRGMGSFPVRAFAAMEG
jgi:kynurenine formamidase